MRLTLKQWDKGSELRITERLSLPVFFCLFVCLFFFGVIHSTCKYALRKESTIKCSVDDLELSMISAEKVPRSGFAISTPYFLLLDEV